MNSPVVIIIPVYNEAENLKILIPKIYGNVKNAYLVIVDDNSNDNTVEILNGLSKKYKKITHLKRKAKLGRGTAVIYGFKYALKNNLSNYFLEMDADLSHDPVELPSLLKYANEQTIVIASRYIRGSRIVNSPSTRRFLSKLANGFNSLLFELPIHDNTNGYRLYPKKAVEILVKHKFKSSGFVTIAECTYLLYKRGFKLKERPTVFVNRAIGGSKADLHEIFISFRDLLKIRFSK